METIGTSKYFPLFDCKSVAGFILTLTFGIILPVIALAFNFWLSMHMRNFDMLYTVGAMFLLPRAGYLYITIGSGIVTLLLWLLYFRKHGQCLNGFIGGILLFNALFYFVFGVMGVVRLFIIPVWLPPFCAVPVLFLSGVKSLKIARTVIPSYMVILSTIAGVVFVVIISLCIVPQPWDFIKHLPNADGANFSGMDLHAIYLDGASGVTFEGTDFSHTNLRDCSFVTCNINMQHVNMQGADLTNAVLSVINLKEADLRDVNLSHAEIYEVDFTGADFQGASLGFHAIGRIIMKDVNMCGADLSRLENMDGIYEWEGATYNSSTLWPPHFMPQAHGMVLDQHGAESTSD